MTTLDKILQLDCDDEKLLAELEKAGEEKLVELLRDLRVERTLEYQIYASREQWLWIPWTTCLGGSIVALTAASPLIRIGVTLVCGLFALWIAHCRRIGLQASFDALNMRHKWVVHVTRCMKAKARLRVLGFDDRLDVHKGSPPRDPLHLLGFGYPLHARKWTVFVWTGLLAVAILSSFYTWSPIHFPMPDALQPTANY